MVIDFSKAPLQNEYTLLPNSLYSAKQAEVITGVKQNRIYYFTEASILTPAQRVKKGNEIRTFTSYDCTNMLEIFLIHHLTTYGLPKRTIKEFFLAIKDDRHRLDPFVIEQYQGVAYLCFVYDKKTKDITFLFLDDQKKEDTLNLSKLKQYSVYLVINLSELAKELFLKVATLV